MLSGVLKRLEAEPGPPFAGIQFIPPWGGTSRAGALLLGLAVAGAALAVGTVHTVTLVVVTGVLALAAALTWAGADASNMRPAATLLLVTAVALTGYTALQCVPIPMALLRVIAPRNADIWSRVLTPLQGAEPSWAPLSLDPPATRIEALKGVAYLLAFVTSLRIVRRRGGISFLSLVLVLTGVALALAAVLHPAFGAHKLYGFIVPTAAIEPRHLAPFLNPNNLAGYLNIAFCIALATTISPDPRFPRSLSGSVALMIAATQVWVASRGGVAAMVLGMAAVVVLSRPAALGRSTRSLNVSLALLLALATGGVLVGVGSSPEVSSELLNTGTRFKFELFRDAVRMIPAYPVFGAGRGAFESTFPAFRSSIWVNTFTHPENVLLQWTIEWGLPVAAAGLVAVAIALRPRTALARSSAAVGPWAAIVAVAAQNMVDLGTEIPGLMLAVVVCAAMVSGGTAGRRAAWRIEAWGRAPAVVAAAAIASACVAIAVALTGLDRELDAQRLALFAAAREPTTSATEMRSLARAAMLMHPGEPYLPFIAGWRAESAGDDDVMPWLEATLERAPIYAPAHLVLAEFLARRSPAQARMEYRLAAEQAPESTWSIAREAARLVGGYDDAMEVVPHGSGALPTLESLIEYGQMRLPATCVRLDAEIVARAPATPGPALHAASDAIEDLEAGDETPWCAGSSRPSCAAHALTLTERAEALDPRSCAPHLLHARAEAAAGEVGRGLASLASAADMVMDRVPCLQQLAKLADDAHDRARWLGAVDKIATSGCASDTECAGNLAWAAGQQETHGKPGDALALYKRAYERTPGDDSVLEHIAKVAAIAGLHTEAAEAYERLARRQPTEMRWKRAADAQREAL